MDSTALTGMYSALLTGLVVKMKENLHEMEVMLSQLDSFRRAGSSITDSDSSIMLQRFSMLERRIAAMENSKNVYINEESSAWLVGEESPVGNEVVDLEAAPLVVSKVDDAAAAAAAAAKAKEEAAAAAKLKEEEAAAAAAAREAEAEARAVEAKAAAMAKAAEAKAAADARAAAEEARAAEIKAAQQKMADEKLKEKLEQIHAAAAEEEEEDAEEGVELTEFEYKGTTYYRDEDNLVYHVDDEGEVDTETPIGRYNEKTGGVKLFAKTA